MSSSAVERAFAFAEELDVIADSSPTVQIIDRCESFLVGDRRGFRRWDMENILQARFDALEKKAS